MITDGRAGRIAGESWRRMQLREYILIDFENVQPATVGNLQPGVCGILLFLGEKQSKIGLDLMRALQRFGEAVEMIQISGSGPNAVDFHIAYTIGKLAQLHPEADFTIVSRDTGFDPLVRYVSRAGIRCRRVASLGGVSTRPAPAKKAVSTAAPAKKTTAKVAKPAPKAASRAAAPKGRVDEVVARLKGLKAARPRRLKTLQSSIASWFKPALSDAQVTAVVQELATAGHLSIADGKVAYAIK